jgi:hypothetical protein
VDRSLSFYIPIGSAIVHPQRTISKAGLILFAGILLGIFIPGYFYKLCHTFYWDDIATILPNNPSLNPNPKPTWEAYAKTKEGLQNSVTAIDARIASEGNPIPLPPGVSAVNDITSLVEQRAKLQSALDNLKANPPFHLAGFYLESLMIMWPAFYICLAWLIFILAPAYPRRPGIRRWIPLFIGTFVLYRWPTWMRNVPALRYIERHVYANGNWDLSVGSFVVQEVQAVLACVLLVAVWAIWADFIPVWQAQVRECLWGDRRKERLPEFAESFVRLFVHWQVCSLILAGGFIPYTFFFWNYVIEYGDKRYLAHALIMHGIWGVTWLLISMPLAWTWYQWNVRYRLEVQMTAKPPNSAEEKNAIEMGSLIGSWNVMGSLATAVLAFGFPVVKEILTHL